MKKEDKLALFVVLPIGIIGMALLMFFLLSDKDTYRSTTLVQNPVSNEKPEGPKPDNSEIELAKKDAETARAELAKVKKESDITKAELAKVREEASLARAEPAAGRENTRADNALTVDYVRKAIVGMWNGTEEPSLGSVIAFDSHGLITERGFAAGGGLLGDAATREGKVRYRLEPNKEGMGVDIIEIDEKNVENAIYVVEAIDAEIAKMRAGDDKSKRLVLWKRMNPIPQKREIPSELLDDEKIPELTQLLSNGADGFDLGDALRIASIHTGGDSLETIKILLREGADVNARNKQGETPLINAIRFNDGSAKHVELLLDNGADVNATSKDGSSPLSFATQNVEIVKLLLSKGAVVNSKSEFGNTALIEVIRCCGSEGSVIYRQQIAAVTEIVKLLLEAGEV